MAARTPAASAAPRPAARTLTPADDGAVVPLQVGGAAELVVRDAAAADPQVEGTAVVLVELRNVTGSGRREWEVRAVREGTAVVRGDAPVPWSLTFTVQR